MIYGYARVSTTDQNLDRQIEAFNKFGVDKIFSDKMSGKNFERENYIEIINRLKYGDLLVIKSIDRLGRNYDMIIDEWRKITREIGADILVLDMPLLDTRNKDNGLTGKFISDLVLQILSYVAQTERDNIKKRQAEGIALAKAKGKHLGRPKYVLPDNFEEVAKKWYNNEISIFEALKLTEMNKNTFAKYTIKNGYNKHCCDCYYHLVSDYETKDYVNEKQLLNELNTSIPTLRAHLNGKFNIIDKIGIKITRIKYDNQKELGDKE